ncbi:uncharacterized protein LOC126746904 [Anthonomus grandis grandis]|uniref:uncharacterized protein LOC126746904 n=1 Tax=Anthonomus grandis grandis TaxID=2921223 RepID=UPI00216691E8|nr:uncharacterized protein LOC126746904 [Anthonomus grandis grandis]XP_050311275.1 uncharacterized protein LOC126746904 [Anthonomus grandis grandis]
MQKAKTLTIAVTGVCAIILFAVLITSMSKLFKELPFKPTLADLGNPGCEIDPLDNNARPIVTISRSTEFLYPKWNETVLRFNYSEEVDFVCPGSVLLNSSQEILQGKCYNGTTFIINDQHINWSALKCAYNRSLIGTIRATKNKCNSNAGKELEIGFELTDGRFLRTILICFDPETQLAFWTYIKQIASINKRFRAYSTPPLWSSGQNIYNISDDINSLYTNANQRRTINQLLDLQANSTKYIKKQKESNHFLSRGHMAARADFFYPIQQNATYFMPNAAPQWQSLNKFNWNQTEVDVRNYASNHGVDLQVWTGVHGVTTLMNNNTQLPTKLYLYVNASTKALPVPEIFYKVVYNPDTGKGVALIGVNNPYNSTFIPICEDVSSKITWLRWNKDDQMKGFCYACTISSFRNVVEAVPSVDDKGLLLQLLV